jgi:hypothetical protein
MKIVKWFLNLFRSNEIRVENIKNSHIKIVVDGKVIVDKYYK